jgi:hypothetical protein
MKILQSMKLTALSDIVMCSVVQVDRRFRGAYHLHHYGDRRENLKSHLLQSTLLAKPVDSHDFQTRLLQIATGVSEDSYKYPEETVLTHTKL